MSELPTQRPLQSTSSDFIKNLEEATGEPVWLTILGLAGEGLVELTADAREKTLESLAAVRAQGPRHMGPEESAQAVRHLQYKLETLGNPREVFCSFVNDGGHKRADGSFRTYKEIAELFGSFRSGATYFRWMKVYFPKVAREMSQKFFNG